MEINISNWWFVPFWDSWGDLHHGRSISAVGAKHLLADQPNCCLHFRWLNFGLIRSPPSSAFHLGKLRRAEWLKRDCSLGHKSTSFLTIFPRRWPLWCFLLLLMVFPSHGGHHFLCSYMYKYVWTCILDLVKCRKHTSKKFQEQMKRFVKQLSWSLSVIH